LRGIKPAAETAADLTATVTADAGIGAEPTDDVNAVVLVVVVSAAIGGIAALPPRPSRRRCQSP
jgi:hypothetical protein